MTPAPISAELAAHRKRRYIMISIVSVCFILAGAMVMGYYSTHQRWMLWVFAAVILTGFAAQGWMIVRFAQSGKPKA